MQSIVAQKSLNSRKSGAVRGIRFDHPNGPSASCSSSSSSSKYSFNSKRIIGTECFEAEQKLSRFSITDHKHSINGFNTAAAASSTTTASRQQQTQRFVNLLDSLISKDAETLAKAWRLTAVPASRLPSFYSRRHCSCKSGNASDSEADAVKKDFKTVNSGAVAKRRQANLVQTKICDMFPIKKRLRLQQQQPLANSKKSAM